MGEGSKSTASPPGLTAGAAMTSQGCSHVSLAPSRRLDEEDSHQGGHGNGLYVGKRFPTFSSVFDELSQYAKLHYLLFKRHDSRRMKNYLPMHKKMEDLGLTVEGTRSIHEGYACITWTCIHFGEPRTRSKGVRKNQMYYAKGCRWRLAVHYIPNRLGGHWEVYRYFRHHNNHEVGPAYFARMEATKKCLRDDKTLVQQVAALLSLDVNPRVLKDYVEKTSDYRVKMKDIHNLIQYIRQHHSDMIVDGGEESKEGDEEDDDDALQDEDDGCVHV